MLGLRILTATVLITLFVPSLFFLPPVAWIAICTLAVAGCAWEWGGLSGLKLPSRAVYAAGVGLAAGYLATTPIDRQGWYVASTVFWCALAPWLLWRRPTFQGPWLRLLLGVVVLLPVELALIDLRGISPGLLLAVMAIVWISDSAAYFAGRSFGRNKLAPAVSPGKTWEGVYGALAAVFVYAIICVMWMAPLVIPRWSEPVTAGPVLVVLLWLLLAAGGIVGDLIESLFKRAAGVKDSGSLLPGHGGILDRVDALLPILPVAALFYLR
jgi:phosphatidate cytidylyltransferase